MSEILKGMTREQALGCLCEFSDVPGNWALVKDGKIYGCPEDLGLTPITCPNTIKSTMCRACWEAAINAHYNDLEKPKWVEPYMDTLRKPELFHIRGSSDGHLPEIARTNARRRIEAFVAANGGGGKWCFIVESRVVTSIQSEPYWVGTIGCATRELAEAVIEHFPDELRLLAGLEENK
jgi:hypothetical protein